LKFRAGVSNAVFAGTAVVLLILAGVGFGLYFTGLTSGQTTAEMTTGTTTTAGSGTDAVQFVPASGQMVHGAWVLIEPTGSGQFAVSIYAQGLESTGGTGNVYIVEGAQSSGSMSVVPIGPNATASEFETSGTGVGSYFTLLDQNPYSSFENLQIVYLPGMQMSDAVVVATATLSMMSH
jgi:hypothetical protein